MVEKEFEKEASAGLKKRSLNEMFRKMGYSFLHFLTRDEVIIIKFHSSLFLWSQT